MPNVLYEIPFRGTLLHFSYSSVYNEWKAMLPGFGGCGGSLASTINDAHCRWKAGGAPKTGHLVGACGYTVTPIDLPALLELAQPWERGRITALMDDHAGQDRASMNRGSWNEGE